MKQSISIAFAAGAGMALSSVHAGEPAAGGEEFRLSSREYSGSIAGPREAAAADDWRVDFNSWIWLMGVEGTTGVRGNKADVSATFGDILEASNSLFAFSGRLEVGKGNWGGFVDGMFADVGAKDQSGPAGRASIDVSFQQVIVDFGVTYRLADWEASGEASDNRRNGTLDLYAGGRYTNLELELDPANLPPISRSVSWLDPIIGAKVVLPLSERWHLRANTDIGGFGVESDLTWSATAVLGYDFSIFNLSATFFGGYRAIGWDFSKGSGSDEFVFDVVQHGPILGFALKF